MSGAYLREPDDGAGGDRPVSQHPNFVTADGLQQIELQLARAQHGQDMAEAAGDEAAARGCERDVRYWVARRATAQVVAAPPDAGRVHFGSTVEVEAADGARQTWRIVGEDEADASIGTLSYVSTLAQALVGRKVGETAQLGDPVLTITRIG